MKKILNSIRLLSKETAIGLLLVLATAQGNEITSSMKQFEISQKEILHRIEQLEERIDKLEDEIL